MLSPFFPNNLLTSAPQCCLVLSIPIQYTPKLPPPQPTSFNLDLDLSQPPSALPPLPNQSPDSSPPQPTRVASRSASTTSSFTTPASDDKANDDRSPAAKPGPLLPGYTPNPCGLSRSLPTAPPISQPISQLQPTPDHLCCLTLCLNYFWLHKKGHRH